MGAETFTLMAIINATDHASSIMDRIMAKADQMATQMTAASREMDASLASVDHSLLKTASGLDAMDVATARVEGAEARAAIATRELAAAEQDLLIAQQLGASEEDLALTTDRLAAAERKAAAASKELSDAQKIQQETARAATVSEDETAAAQARLATSSKTTGEAMGMAGKIAAGAAIGVGVIGYESVKTAMKFQQSMTMIRTQANDTTDNIDKMGTAVIEMSTKVGMSPDQLAQGLYHIASAGIRGAQALDILKYAAEGAQVGNANLESVTQAMIAVFRSGIGGVKNMQDAMGQLNAIVGTGDMRMEGLSRAMSTGILSSAKTFGLSLTDVGAALATLTDNAVPPIEAATRLRMTFTMMGAPTQAATKAFNLIGMSGTQLANDMRKPDGLLVAMEDLKKHLNTPITGGAFTGSVSQAVTALKNLGMSSSDAKDQVSKIGVGAALAMGQMSKFGLSTEEINKIIGKLGPNATEQAIVLARAFGGGRTSGAILTLLSEMDTLKSKYPAITSGAKGFEADWVKTTQTAVFQSKSVRASVSAIGTAIGTALLPFVQQFLGYVIRIAGPITSWIASHKKLAATILVVVGAISMLVLAIRGWMVVQAAINFLLDDNPIGVVIMAIAALVAIIIYAYNHFKSFHNMLDTVGRFLKTVFVGSIHLAREAIHALISWFEEHKQVFIDAWHAVVKAVQAAVKWFDDNVLKWVQGKIAGLVSWWNQHSQQIREVWKFLFLDMKVIALVWWNIIKGLLSTIFGFWRLIWGVIKDVVVGVWEIIKRVIDLAMHNIFNTIAVILDIVTGKWGKAWQDLKKLASQGFWDVIHLIGAIGSGLGNLLWDAGVNIVKGLINGIESMIGAAGGAIHDVVSTIKSYLPWSPAKKGPLSGGGSPIYGGRNIVRQIAEGMLSTIPELAQTMDTVMKSTLIKAAGTSPVRGLAGSAGESLIAGFTGSMAIGSTGGQNPVYLNFDLRGSQVFSDRDMDQLVHKIGNRISTIILPSGGVKVNM